ncbi:MAG: endonuclease/exonuclease/phosphatase family protein, partial [Myxococcaceae bacterium]
MSRKLLLLFASVILACGPAPHALPDGGAPDEQDSGSVDSGAQDSGDADAGAPVDDAGQPDSGQPDSGKVTDAGDVDAGVLDTFLLSAPPAFSNDSDAGFTFSSDFALATFECSLDSASFASCSSPFGYSALSEGGHLFAVRAVDVDGGVDPTPATASWSVDLTPPDTTLTSAPSGDLSVNSATFTFSSEPGASFECSLDGAAFTPCASGAGVNYLSSGPHSFEIRAKDEAGNVDPTPASASWNVLPGTTLVRIVAANTSSGNLQSYDPGEGIRMFEGLHPDVVLIQEFNYGTNSSTDLQTFMNVAFPPGYSFYRQPGSLQIPNGVISRFPIIASGTWDDTLVSNRDFAWARIDLPGTKDLWAVSVHLLTTSGTNRSGETSALAAFINANVPSGDFLAIGGDFNT